MAQAVGAAAQIFRLRSSLDPLCGFCGGPLTGLLKNNGLFEAVLESSKNSNALRQPQMEAARRMAMVVNLFCMYWHASTDRYLAQIRLLAV
mgnify:CR=1 FL=1